MTLTIIITIITAAVLALGFAFVFVMGYSMGGCQDRAWIPIEDGPPKSEEYDWVLVNVRLNEDGSYGVPMVAEYRNDVWWEQFSDVPLEEMNITVTHWMPLPVSPKNNIKIIQLEEQ